MIKQELISQKLQSIFNHSGAKTILTWKGMSYDGMLESNTYTQQYRDTGYVDNVLKTWIGAAFQFEGEFPESNDDVVVGITNYRVAGYQLDPVAGVIRVDLKTPNAGDLA